MKNVKNTNEDSIRVIGNEFATTDYSLFKYYKGNRTVAKHRVKRIVSLFEKGRYNIPILVKLDKRDGKLVIMDGQTRYEACMELKLPIIFVYDTVEDMAFAKIKAMGYNSIPDINRNAAWTVQDHIDTQSNVGVKSAMDIKKIEDDYDFKSGLAISTLFGKPLNKSSVANQSYPDYDLNEALKLADILHPYVKGSNHKLFRNMHMIATLRWFLLDDTFDFKYMVKTLNGNPEAFTNVSSYAHADAIMNRVYGNSRGKYRKNLAQWRVNAQARMGDFGID